MAESPKWEPIEERDEVRLEGRHLLIVGPATSRFSQTVYRLTGGGPTKHFVRRASAIEAFTERADNRSSS